MNGIAKTSVVKSYSRLVNTLESPKYMDGIFSKSTGRWDISYDKNNIKGYVTKSGMVVSNGIKVNISDEGKLKPVSAKAFLLGKRGLKKVETMLDDITRMISNPNASDKNSKVKLNLEYKSWMYKE